jgi:photosystem II stability/assembly factor-like uncharacterized protein
MKYIIASIFAFLVFVTSSNAMAQDIEEGETSETILQRERYILDKRAGGPGLKLPNDAYEKAVIQMMQMPKDSDVPGSFTSLTSWVSVSPLGMFYARTGANYVSGRTNSIAFHPTNQNIMYIAAAQGGVWKTTDNGHNWIALTDNLGSIASGDIAIDPQNPNVLYYGTGELNFSGDSQYGDGIYKTTNAGTTWTKIAAASFIGQYVGKITVDPANTNNIYCAGNAGVFKSSDGGLNWTNLLVMNSTSLVINPVNPQIIYAASGSGQCQIHKSTNGGSSWYLITNGVNASAGRRTQLAMSPDNPDILYASIATSSGSLNGLYKTTDGGDNWTLQNNTTNYLGSQGWYDNSVVVVPGNPDHVIVGGIDVYSSTDAGVTLTRKSIWSTTVSSEFSHADIHWFAYKGSLLYCCSDGGVYVSHDNATTWTDLNATISTLQYKSADYDPTDVNILYGGTQDNNKTTSTNYGIEWIQRTTGDGGYTIVDPIFTSYVYGQYVNGSIQRSANYGISFSSFTPAGSSGGLFYNPYEMAPGDNETIIFGRADLWKTWEARSATSSSGWRQIATTAIMSGNVSAIGISKQDTGKLYIGTSNGRIHVTTDGGLNWATQTGFPYVTDFWVDRNNDNVCYATFGGATADKHVYKTTNSGQNWFSITSNLPNIAHNSIVIRETAPRIIFVGTDLGMYSSTNDGVSWASFNTGLPNVEINDLKYKEGPALLLAATYGRGCYTFDLSTLSSVGSSSLAAEDFALHQNYPNPFNPSTVITYSLKKQSDVSLKVYDALGRETRTLVNKTQGAGTYTLRFEASELPAGVYYYKLIAGDYSDVKKMLLIK